MTRTRWLILIAGPLPIVATSMVLSALFKDDPSQAMAVNDAFGGAGFVNVAKGAEKPVSPRNSDSTKSAASDSLESRCRQKATRLEPKLSDECHVLVRSPFIIAGDMSIADLENFYRRTIRPAADAMANCYFKAPPTEPITVLLFRNETSYNQYAKQLFGERQISVYGYYKPRERTLVMNIGTGSGTLVHELTHALVDFDFPDVPDWFNEGLASLHEQCQFRDGKDGAWIEGLPNWRLKGLQKTISQKRLRSLKEMIEANDFRGDLEGTNYAQARYFCMYMQREGQLTKFYDRFRLAHKNDPLGVKTLGSQYSDLGWADLDRNFQTWVMTLSTD